MAPRKLFVSNKDESPQIFRHKIPDYLSRVHFSIPLFIYLPIIGYFLYRAIALYDLPGLTVAGLFMVAILAWTLTEYVVHRFVFHYHPKSKLGQQIHFLTHGVHHDYPNDSLRLVMPPGASLPLAVGFYALFYFTMGPVYAAPFFAGFVFGYLAYDMIHYATHHVKTKNKLFKRIQKSHMTHHYKEPDAGYSVSVLFWDNIFGTTFARKARRDSAQRGE